MLDRDWDLPPELRGEDPDNEDWDSDEDWEDDEEWDDDDEDDDY